MLNYVMLFPTDNLSYKVTDVSSVAFLFVCLVSIKREYDKRQGCVPIIGILPCRFLFREVLKMNYTIKHATNENELKSILGFAENIFNTDFDFNIWRERLNAYSELLIYAEAQICVIGCTPSYLEANGNVTVGIVAVDNRFRKHGIASALLREVEKQTIKIGSHLIALGSVEEAEKFYQKRGFVGQLLIQSEKHSIDELSALNPGYPVAFTNVYDGKINQLCLKLDEPDRELQRLYETTFDGCHTQTMFWKTV